MHTLFSIGKVGHLFWRGSIHHHWLHRLFQSQLLLIFLCLAPMLAISHPNIPITEYKRKTPPAHPNARNNWDLDVIFLHVPKHMVRGLPSAMIEMTSWTTVLRTSNAVLNACEWILSKTRTLQNPGTNEDICVNQILRLCSTEITLIAGCCYPSQHPNHSR